MGYAVTLETNATQGAPKQQAADRPGGSASASPDSASGPAPAQGRPTTPPPAAPGRPGAAPTASGRPGAGAAPVRSGGPSGDGLRKAFRRRFRMPGTADPRVRLRRLGLVAAWATVLGFGGLVMAVRLLIGLFTRMPNWYLPTISGLGVFGVACTVGAMASVHRRHTPWVLLAAATVTLLVAWEL
jgi:hypothetical protein